MTCVRMSHVPVVYASCTDPTYQPTNQRKHSAETLRHLRSLELFGKGFTPQQHEDLAIMEKQVGLIRMHACLVVM